MKTTAFLLTMFVPAVASAQQKPTTGYAPVNGLKMYYEVHGSGEPVVLLHGAFMTIGNSKTASRPEFGTSSGNLVPKNYSPSPVGISKSW